MKKIMMLVMVLFLGLASFIALKTVTFSSKQLPVSVIEPIALNEPKLIEHLVKAIQFKTISYDQPKRRSRREFLRFINYLNKAYPLVRKQLQRERVNKYSLLYTWPGKNESLKPILIMAHYDVVPVSQETEREWMFPPFSGKKIGGHVWGRGAIDNKFSVMSVLDAFELLLEEGFVPQRSIYFALGHDEEVGGLEGAAKIAEIFREQNLEFEYILDEGGAVAVEFAKQIPQPVALVGIAEKGYLTLQYKVKGITGHSSMPDNEQPIFILVEALHRSWEARKSAEPKLEGPTRQLIEHIGPEMNSVLFKAAFANLWLFDHYLAKKLAQGTLTKTVVKSTGAATGISGGEKENVLADNAQALINFRILPGQSLDEILQSERAVVNDPRVEITALNNYKQPSDVSDVNSGSFQMLARTIREQDDDVIVAPWLFVASTDSRHYAPFSENIYRFNFIKKKVESLKSIHGTNERISTQNYLDSVRFYRQLILNSQDNF